MSRSLYEYCKENEMLTLLSQWDTQKNGALTPHDVSYGSKKKVWWRCEKGHGWQARGASRIHGNGCPVCAGKQIIAGVNDLASRFPQIAGQWHPTKNEGRTPQSVSAYSNTRAWWICELGHEYQAFVAHRTNMGSGCPYCANRKVLAGFNDLASQEPQIAAQWHPTLNGDLTPQMVTPGSAKKAWWQCEEGHVWKTAIYSRAARDKCGCPVCSGKVKVSKHG